MKVVVVRQFYEVALAKGPLVQRGLSREQRDWGIATPARRLVRNDVLRQGHFVTEIYCIMRHFGVK